MASAAGSPLDGAASPSADGWGAVAADSDEDLGAGDDAGDLLSDEELEDVPALAQRDLGPPDSSSSDDDADNAPPDLDLDEAAADDAMNSALAAEYGGAQILAPSDNGAAAATAATIRFKTESHGGQRDSSLRERGLLLWVAMGLLLPSIGTPFAVNRDSF